jgi:hypothetical protein
MLKLTYTEFGLHLERVSTPLETLVGQRLMLALRLGESLHVEPSRAAFLLSIHVDGFDQLIPLVRSQANSQLSIAPVDEEFVEVSVYGSWIASTCEAHEGMFVTVLSDRAEFFVEKLWQATQVQIMDQCKTW